MEVTIELRDATEVQLVGSALLQVHAYRAGTLTAAPAAPPPEKDPVVGSITPEGVTRPSDPTDDDIRAAVLAYADKGGMAACVALLAEFGAKRAGDIPNHRRGEFIGRTTA